MKSMHEIYEIEAKRTSEVTTRYIVLSLVKLKNKDYPQKIFKTSESVLIGEVKQASSRVGAGSVWMSSLPDTFHPQG